MPTPPIDRPSPPSSLAHKAMRLGLWAAGLMSVGLAGLLLLVAMALAMAHPNLPDVSELLEYRPKLPLRIYSADQVLLGEFGEERRSFTPIKDIPQVMKTRCWPLKTPAFTNTAASITWV